MNQFIIINLDNNTTVKLNTDQTREELKNFLLSCAHCDYKIVSIKGKNGEHFKEISDQLDQLAVNELNTENALHLDYLADLYRTIGLTV